jgi:hypothetical protein
VYIRLIEAVRGVASPVVCSTLCVAYPALCLVNAIGIAPIELLTSGLQSEWPL